MRFPELPDSLLLIEEETLEKWQEEDLFRQTLDKTAEGTPFVFYEGPPTANGKPGLTWRAWSTLAPMLAVQKTRCI